MKLLMGVYQCSLTAIIRVYARVFRRLYCSKMKLMESQLIKELSYQLLTRPMLLSVTETARCLSSYVDVNELYSNSDMIESDHSEEMSTPPQSPPRTAAMTMETNVINLIDSPGILMPESDMWSFTQRALPHSHQGSISESRVVAAPAATPLSSSSSPSSTWADSMIRRGYGIARVCKDGGCTLRDAADIDTSNVVCT